MMDLERTSRIVAASPIEVGQYRFLPSVMVTLLTGKTDTHMLQVYPVSIVEEGPEGTHWHAIPDINRQALSIMFSVSAVVTLISLVAIITAQWVKGKKRG